MPKIDTRTPRAPVTIAGYEFTCPQPYVAGHPLSEGEAEALNTLFVDRVKTNMVRSVLDAVKAAIILDHRQKDECQFSINDYAERYEFTSRSDPIRRKALALAMDSIKTMALRDGLTLTPESVRAKAEAALASGRYPQLIEAARNFVEAQRAFAQEELER